jgi:phenylpropionate dioxygenase-like ring-hydroxylating dioxygenase large terminal subunit
VTALKKDRPNAAQLLNKRLVVWWDAKASSSSADDSSSTGAWRVHEDLCPHRLAPLSEGRLHESGQLQCTYHGWTFDGLGACTSIPQLDDAKAHATACASPRSCVRAFGVHEHLGLLWVHAGGSSSSDGSGSSSSDGSAPPAHLLAPPGYKLMRCVCWGVCVCVCVSLAPSYTA